MRQHERAVLQALWWAFVSCELHLKGCRNGEVGMKNLDFIMTLSG